MMANDICHHRSTGCTLIEYSSEILGLERLSNNDPSNLPESTA